MRIVRGTEVLTELAELVDPARTALLIVDLQRDFCADDGVSGRAGRDLVMVKKAVANTRRVLDAARATSVLPIFIQNIQLPELRSVSGPWLRALIANGTVDIEKGWTLLGTPGAEIAPEIAPRGDDIVVQKFRSSAFFGTGLATILRANEIRSVICVGAVTEGCLESTARDAVFHEFYTVVLEDCVGSFDPQLHEAALRVLKTRCDVVTSAQVLDVWSRSSRREKSQRTGAA
jgi:nicotinamidase-related amidase